MSLALEDLAAPEPSVDIDGGPERRLLELREDRYNGLAWSPDGRSIAYAERPSASQPYAVFLLSTDKLVTRRLTTPPPGVGELRFAFSPDSQTLAVIRVAEASITVRLVSIETGTDTALLTGLQEWLGGITWSADGRYLMLSGNQQGSRHLSRLPVTEAVSSNWLLPARTHTIRPSLYAADG